MFSLFFKTNPQHYTFLPAAKKSIYLETQHEGALNRMTYLEDENRHKRSSTVEETVTQAPVFTMPVRDVRVAENQAVHFEARLIPVGDPKLRVEWLRNGVAIAACKFSFFFALKIKITG